MSFNGSESFQNSTTKVNNGHQPHFLKILYPTYLPPPPCPPPPLACECEWPFWQAQVSWVPSSLLFNGSMNQQVFRAVLQRLRMGTSHKILCPIYSPPPPVCEQPRWKAWASLVPSSLSFNGSGSFQNRTMKVNNGHQPHFLKILCLIFTPHPSWPVNGLFEKHGWVWCLAHCHLMDQWISKFSELYHRG